MKRFHWLLLLALLAGCRRASPPAKDSSLASPAAAAEDATAADLKAPASNPRAARPVERHDAESDWVENPLVAAERDLDPNRWFLHVEKVAAEEIGRETVDYVAHINKYYLAYRLAYRARQDRESAKASTGS